MSISLEKIRKNAPEGATHYLDDNYYAKDYIVRWCCVDDNGDAWPCSNADHEYNDENLIPL